MDMRKLKEGFRNYGVSQQTVAGVVNLPAPLVSQIFSGKIRASEVTQYRLEKLLALCDAVERMVSKKLSQEVLDEFHN